MARVVQVVLEDDLDGGTADETVVFGLDGISYEIDLTGKNAEKLRAALQPYVEGARRVRGKTPRRAASGASSRSQAGEIRAWAQANGISVNARGRIPADVVAQYEAAHA